MDDNTFEEQLIEYFGGSTDTQLGEGVISSWLQETKSDRFKIGYEPASLGRGIDMGATIGVSNSAFLDFNSLDNGTNDYDTRFVSVGGTAGVNGRGTLQIIGDQFLFIGNTTNPAPLIQLPNAINFIGGVSVYHAPTNQGRLISVRQIEWSGNLASGTTQLVDLKDLTTGFPFTGHYTITLSNGRSGTGASQAYSSYSITKTTVGLFPWQWLTGFEEGDNLSNLYTAVDPTNSLYPRLLLGNTTADPARYIIEGFVFYDQDM